VADATDPKLANAYSFAEAHCNPGHGLARWRRCCLHSLRASWGPTNNKEPLTLAGVYYGKKLHRTATSL
jgi:hypothetical protein